MEKPTPPPSPLPAWDPAAEIRTAWLLTGGVLLTLLLVKPLGGLPWLGPIAFTMVAGMQLYLPIWRMDKLRLGYDFLGLDFSRFRDDLKLMGVLCLVTFIPYAIGHHLFMTEAHSFALELGLPQIAAWFPRSQFAPSFPHSLSEWAKEGGWFLTMSLTHLFGVALPEETFYRGYLQPRLEAKWKPKTIVFGAPIGKAALITAGLFALGHFLGEWNPLRLGPFFPALVFAWQRNRTGSILGAIGFHGLCNIFGELLFKLYVPS